MPYVLVSRLAVFEMGAGETVTCCDLITRRNHLTKMAESAQTENLTASSGNASLIANFSTGCGVKTSSLNF